MTKLIPLIFIGSAVGSVLAGSGGSARAENLRLGGSISLLPIGQIHVEGGGLGSQSADTAMAWGLGGVAELQIAPHISVGFAPRLLLNVKGQDGDESAKELDVAARLIADTPVGPVARFYGFAAPGYSILYIPDWPEELANPAGFVLGLGGGVAFDVNPQLRMGIELGYQFGAQGVSEQGETLDIETSFLHFGLNVMARL